MFNFVSSTATTSEAIMLTRIYNDILWGILLGILVGGIMLATSRLGRTRSNQY